MGRCVDLMKEAFLKIADDGELILNEDYMMNIFKPIRDTVTPLDEYLTMMFEEKQGNVLSSRLEEDKVLPYDILRAELS